MESQGDDKGFGDDGPQFAKECSGGLVVTAFEGDDVTIRLQLDPEAPPPTSVKWRRADDHAIGERFQSIESGGGDSVELGGDRVTIEDSGAYWAVASNPWGQSTVPVDLRVLPQHPNAPQFLRRLTDLAVKVGTRTRFLVEIKSASEIRVIWLKDGSLVEEGERFHLLNEGNFFCIDVAPVTLDDTGRWSCLAKNVNGQATCSCKLSVLVPKAYKKPEFVEELKALLTAQGTVSLECKVVGVPTPTLKWFKDDKEIRAGDVFALTADPKDPTSLGTYTCQATNCVGRALSTSKVHVLGTNKEGAAHLADSILPPGPVPEFSKELRNENVKIGGSLMLECRVKVPPWPKVINWYNKEGEVKEGGRYHIMEDGLGSYSILINPLQAADDGPWKCVATSNTGVKAYTTCEVQMAYPKNYRKPKFLESLKAILTEEGLVSFECKVVGYPTPNLTWFKDGQELKPGDVYQLTGTNSLGTYCCIAKNCMGEASSIAELTIEDIQSQLSEQERMQLFSGCHPPRFIQGLKSMEAKINDKLKFTIQVSVSPEPSVLWFRDDEQIEESNKFHIEKELLGIYHFHITKLEFCDQAEWKCVATNEYGQSVTSCFLKLNIPKHYKKPKFLENLRAVLSDEGAVNLECKVIGVPQPVLKWYKDGKELKAGDIHRIISGQDGTCCLGTYTCEANNCMGTVSSSASLLGFEERDHGKSDAKSPHIPLARNPSLSTIHEERTSQMHDTERSLTIDERADEISFSFDGKEVSVSLYETPDLTEEEALQIVEMYADQISEHVSEHNVVDLPPMRFTKESSTSGNLMMEAVVIDVSQDYFSAAEDDLRTDADLEEFSIFEDPAGPTPDDEGVFDKLNREFFERALAPIATAWDNSPDKPPIKPPRRKSDGNKVKKAVEVQIAEEEDASAYTDALGSIHESQEGSKVTPVKLQQEKVTQKHESLPLKGKEKLTSLQNNQIKVDEKTARKVTARRKSSDSEKEDDSLKEFEKRKYLKSMQKVNDRKNKDRKRTDSEMEDDSLYEFENRKSCLSEYKPDEEANQQAAGVIPMIGQVTEALDIKPLSEKESSGKENKKKKKGIKVPPLDSNECEEHSGTKVVEVLGDVSARRSNSLGSDVGIAAESLKTMDDDEKSGDFDTAEAFDRSDMSVLESLTHSLQEIQDGLAQVEAQVLTESAELHSAKSSISVIESLALPINEIKRGLELVEQQLTEECAAGNFSQSKMEAVILETLAQPITEFNRNLALVEQQIALEGTCESLLERTNHSILETVVQPLQEFNREIALIQQHTIVDSESGRSDSTPDVNIIKESVEEKTCKIEQTPFEFKKEEQLTESSTLLSKGEDKKINESKKKTLLKSLSVELRELEENASDDLAECHEKLMDFGQILRLKAGDEPNPEINTILKSIGYFVSPLKKLTNVTSKCISVIVDDYEAMGLGIGVPSSALMESLTKPLEALKNSLQVLEQVTSYSTDKEIRGGGIPILYKLTAPMDELETTIKLVENLSAHTAMEFLSSPLNKLIKAVDVLHLDDASSGFVENLEEGVQIVRNLDDSVDIMINCINSINKYMPQIEVPTGNITKLTSLIKPMEEFQKHLHSLEEAISVNMTDSTARCANIYQLAQDINKPLELMRMELSILQHQIEADHFGEISMGKQASDLSNAMFSLTGSLENVQSSITVFYESIKRKPPAEPLHLRYALYSLKELTQPMNDLCSTVMKAEEAIIPDSFAIADPLVGMKAVTNTLRDLNECNKSIKSFKVDGDVQPELKLAKMISDNLTKPLDLFQTGLTHVARQVNEKNKHEFNINLLRTMSEPFNVFQKALIKVSEKLLMEDVTKADAFKLKTAIQDLQRSILVIQDQVSFEYGDEPSTIESNMVTLGSLVAPLQTLLSQFSRIQKSISHEAKLTKERRALVSIFNGLTQTIHSLSDFATEIIDNEEMRVTLEANPSLSRAFNSFRKVICGIDSDFRKVNTGREDDTVKSIQWMVASSLKKYVPELDRIMDETEISSETAFCALEAFKQLVTTSLKPNLVSVIDSFSKKDVDEDMFISDAVGSIENLKKAVIAFTDTLADDKKFALVIKKDSQSRKEGRSIQKFNELETAILKLRDVIVELDNSEPTTSTKKSKLWNIKLTVDSLVYELDGMEGGAPGSGSGGIADKFGNVLDCVSRIETELNKMQCVSENENPSLTNACKLVSEISQMQYDTLKELVLNENHETESGRRDTAEDVKHQKVSEVLGKQVVVLEKCVEEMKSEYSNVPSSSIQTALDDISSQVKGLKTIDVQSAKTSEEEKQLCGDMVENALAIKRNIEKLEDVKKFDCDTSIVINVSDALTELLGVIGDISTAPINISFKEASLVKQPPNMEDTKSYLPILKSILTSIQDMKHHEESINDKSSVHYFLSLYQNSFLCLVRTLADAINNSHNATNSEAFGTSLNEAIAKMNGALKGITAGVILPYFHNLIAITGSLETILPIGKLSNFYLMITPKLQIILSELEGLHSRVGKVVEIPFETIDVKKVVEEMKSDSSPNQDIIPSTENYVDLIAGASLNLEVGLLKVEKLLLQDDLKEFSKANFEEIVAPVTVLNDYIEKLNSIPEVENINENKVIPMSLLKNMAEPIAELKQSVLQVREIFISDNDGNLPDTKADIKNLILAVADPIREVQKNIAVIKKIDKVKSNESQSFQTSLPLDITTPIFELKDVIDCLLQSQVIEREGSFTSNTSPGLLKAIAGPVLSIFEHFSTLDCKQLLGNTGSSEQVKDVYKAISSQVQVIQRELARLEHTVEALVPSESQQDNEVMLSLSQPLLDACNRVVQVIHSFEPRPVEIKQSVRSELGTELKITEENYVDQIVDASRDLEIGLLKTEKALLQTDQKRVTLDCIEEISYPVEVLCKQIESLHTIPEGENVEEMGNSSISLLKNMAKPIIELKRSVAQVREIIISEATADSQADVKELILAIAEPIRELNKNIAVIKELANVENKEDAPILTLLPADKALASPIIELKEAIECLVQSNVIEKEGAMASKDVPELLKAISSPALLILEQLSNIDRKDLYQTTSPMQEKSLAEKYRAIATQVNVLQRELAIVEEQDMLSPGGSQPEKVIVRSLAQPLIEACKNVSTVMNEPLIQFELSAERKESVVVTKSGPELKMPEQNYVNQITEASHDLEVGLLKVEKALLQSDLNQGPIHNIEDIAKPVALLCSYINGLNAIKTGESADEIEPLSLLKNMAEPVGELKRSIAQVQEIIVSEEGGIIPETEADIKNLVLAIAEPVRELTKNIMVIKELASVVTNDGQAITSTLPADRAVANPLLELKEAVDCLVQSQVVEQEGTLTFKNVPYLLKAIARPVLLIHKHLSSLDPTELHKPTSVDSLKGKYNEIATQVNVLQKKLAVVAQQEALSPVRSQPEKAIIFSIAKPLLEACRNVSLVLEECKPSAVECKESIVPTIGPELKLPDQNYLDQIVETSHDLEIGLLKVENTLLQTDANSGAIKTIEEIAHPIGVLCKYIESLNTIPESVGEIEHNTVSLLRNMVEPVTELKRSVAQVQEIILIERGPETEREVTNLILAIAEPIRELKKNIAVIKEVASVSNETQNISTEIKTIASPLIELKDAVDCLVQSRVIAQEGSVSFKSVPDILKAIASPVMLIHKTLSSTDSAQLLKTTSGELIKEKYNEIATQVSVLQKKLAVVEQQEALSPVQSQPEKIIILSLAKPLLEACSHVSLIIEKCKINTIEIEDSIIPMSGPALQMPEHNYVDRVVELGRNLEMGLLSVEKALLLTDLNKCAVKSIEEIAVPVVELCQCIESLNTVPIHESVEVKDDTLRLLKNMAEPVIELKQSVAQVQEIILSECGENIPETETDITNLILAIAEPIRELRKNIGVIKEVADVISGTQSIQTSCPVDRAVATPILELKDAVDCLVQTKVIEQEGSLTFNSSPDLLKAIASPVLLIDKSLSSIDSTEFFGTTTPVNLNNKYNDIATQVNVLLKELAVVEQHVALSPIRTQPEKAIILSLVQPLLEACKHVSLVSIQASKPCITDNTDRTVVEMKPAFKIGQVNYVNQITDASRDLEIGLLKAEKALLQTDQKIGTLNCIEDISNPIRVLCRHIESLNNTREFENVEDLPISLLKNMAEPIEELKRTIAQVQDILVSEDAGSTTDIRADIKNLILAIAEPIRELNKNIAVIKELSNAETKETTPIPFSLPAGKAYASPLFELKEAVECLVQSNVIEKEGKQASMDVPDLLKAISSPVLLIHEHLSGIDNVELLEALSAKTLNEKYNEIANQVVVLQKELVVVEQDESLSPSGSRPEMAVIRSLAQPLMDACTHVSMAMKESGPRIAQIEQLSLLTSEPKIAEKNYVEDFANASRDLEIGLLKVENELLQAERGTVKVIDEIAAPITALCQHLETLNTETISEKEGETDNSPLTLLKTMTEPIVEMQRSIAQVREILVLEDCGKVSESEMEITDLILALAKPIRELRKNVAVIEELADVTNKGAIPLSPESTIQRSFASPIFELKEAVDCLIHSKIIEPEGKLTSQCVNNLLKEIASPVLVIHEHLANVDRHILHDALAPSELQEKYGEIATQVHVIQKELEVLQQQSDLSPTVSPSEHSLILSMAGPLMEACKHVMQKCELCESLNEDTVVKSKSEQILSEHNYLNKFEEASHALEVGLLKAENAILKYDLEGGKIDRIDDVVNAAAVLCNYVESLHVLPLFESVDEISHSPLSLLKTLGEPIKEISQSVAQIQEILVFENEKKITGNGAQIKEMILAIAEPIRELKKNIAVIHEQADISESSVFKESQSTPHSSIFLSPLFNLKEAADCLVQSNVIEEESSSTSKSTPDLLKAISSPVLLIRERLTNISRQEFNETTLLKEKCNDLSTQVNVIQNEVAVVEQQDALSPIGTTSEKSVIVSMIQPLLDACKGVAQMLEVEVARDDFKETTTALGSIHELKLSEENCVNLFVETGRDLEIGLLKLEKAILQADQKDETVKCISELAIPAGVLCKYIDSIDNISACEKVEQLSPSPLLLLRTLAEPIKEMNRSVAQVQEVILLENERRTQEVETGVKDLILAIADPIRELKKNIAVIYEQAHVVSDSATSMTSASQDFRTFATPLMELKEAVDCLVHSNVIEQVNSLTSESSPILLEAITSPVLQIRDHLLNIEREELFETTSSKSVIAKYNQIASQIHTIQKELAVVEQPLVSDTVDIHSEKSIVHSIAQPLIEACKHLALVMEEHGMECLESAGSSTMSDLPTLASVSEISGESGIAVAEKCDVLECITLEHEEEQKVNEELKKKPPKLEDIIPKGSDIVKLEFKEIGVEFKGAIPCDAFSKEGEMDTNSDLKCAQLLNIDEITDQLKPLVSNEDNEERGKLNLKNASELNSAHEQIRIQHELLTPYIASPNTANANLSVSEELCTALTFSHDIKTILNEVSKVDMEKTKSEEVVKQQGTDLSGNSTTLSEEKKKLKSVETYTENASVVEKEEEEGKLKKEMDGEQLPKEKGTLKKQNKTNEKLMEEEKYVKKQKAEEETLEKQDNGEKLKVRQEEEKKLMKEKEEAELKVQEENEQSKKETVTEKLDNESEKKILKKEKEQEKLKEQKKEEEQLMRQKEEEDMIKKQTEEKELTRQNEEENLMKEKEEKELKKVKETQKSKKEMEKGKLKKEDEKERIKKEKEEEVKLKNEKEKEEKLKKQKDKEEELIKQKEEEELLKKQRDEEEKLKKQKEEEELKRQNEDEELKKREEEKEMLKKQKEEAELMVQKEEEMLKKQKKEEEKLIKKNEEEKLKKEKEKEKLKKQKEEDDKLMKQKEEEAMLNKRKEEEEKLKKQKEEEEKLKKQKEEEEKLKKQKEEEETLKKQQEEEEKLMKQKEEEEKLKKQKEEEEKLMIQKEEEENLKKQKEEEEKLMKQKEEDEKLKKQNEEEEKLMKQKEEEEKLKKQKEDEEKLKKQNEEDLKSQREEEEMLKKQKEEVELKTQKEEEKIKIQKEEEEKLKKQKDEENVKKQKLEEEKLNKQKEEERLKKQKEEEDKLKKQNDDEKKLKKQTENEEELKKQKEEERLKKQREEEEKLKKQKEDDEKLKIQKEEEEKLKKQKEEEWLKKQKEEEELRRQNEEEEIKKAKKTEKLKKQNEKEKIKKEKEQEKLKKQQEDNEKLNKQKGEEEKLKKQREEEEKLMKQKEEEEKLKKQKEEEEKLKKQKEEEDKLNKQKVKEKDEEKLMKQKVEDKKVKKQKEEEEEEEKLKNKMEETQLKKQKKKEKVKIEEEDKSQNQKEEVISGNEKGRDQLVQQNEKIEKDKEEHLKKEEKKKIGREKGNKLKKSVDDDRKKGEGPLVKEIVNPELNKNAGENFQEEKVKEILIHVEENINAENERMDEKKTLMKDKDEKSKKEKDGKEVNGLEEENKTTLRIQDSEYMDKQEETLQKKKEERGKSTKECKSAGGQGLKLLGQDSDISVIEPLEVNDESTLTNCATTASINESVKANLEYMATCQIQSVNKEGLDVRIKNKKNYANENEGTDKFKNKLEITETEVFGIRKNESINFFAMEENDNEMSHYYNSNNRSFTPLLSVEKNSMHITGVNSSGQIESISAPKKAYELLTSGKPSFCGRLVDRTVAQGSTVRLSCSVIGEPEPTISWLKDGFSISEEHGSSLYNRYKAKLCNGIATLEISKVVLGDAGKYTCVAKNSTGEATTTSALKIFADYEPAPYSPVFTKTIKDIYKFREDELHLECKVRAYPPPSITWLHNGNSLAMTGRYQQSLMIDGICRLIISNPEPADSGSYTCRAENSICNQEISNFVNFAGREEHLLSRERLTRNCDSKRPQFTSFLTDRLVPTGGTIALHVHVSGFPKPDITWLRGNEVLPRSATSKVHYFEDSGVYSLVVSDATSAHSGVYTCRAVNSYGHTDTTAQIEIVPHGLIKNGKPAMFATRPPTKMTFTSGEDFTLAFHISGDPKPQVKWMKGVTDITDSGRTLKESFGNYVRLTLKRVTAIDAGTYFVVAKNIYGTDRAFVTIKIRERARSLTPTSWDSRDAATILRDVHESVQLQHKGRPWKKRALYW